MIKNQVVTYEIALKLKELGFNSPCMMSYNSYKALKHNISKPSNPAQDDSIYIDKHSSRIGPLYGRRYLIGLGIN